MDHWKLLAEVVGFASSALFLYSAGLTDDKKLSFFYTIGCFILAAHLFMLEAYAGGFTTLLSAFRNIAVRFDKTGKIKHIFMFLFIGIFGYYCINFTSWSALLVPFASIIMSIGFIYFKKNGLSACIVLSCLTWLAYGLIIGSNSIVFLEVSTICSVLFRYFKQNEIIPRFKSKFKTVK